MNATTPVPEQLHVYRNHHLDSTRWREFETRPGDVIICTSLKAGTTWMQRIMSLLVFGPGPLPDTLWRLSPWIDCHFWREPYEELAPRLAAQDHQRFLKSHVALDGLPYQPELRYIYVGRDTRDVFMSLWNHYRSYNDDLYALLDATSPEDGPFPRCPDHPRDLWPTWITRGWFAWERDGWPFWSHHHHAQSFWAFRHLPNLLVVHYNDLLADLDGQMRRVAAFVGVDLDERRWPDLVAAARFETMKNEADVLLPEAALGFKSGPQTFLYKGTNDRWREVLTGDDVALYAEAAAALDPGLRQWLEDGSGISPTSGSGRSGGRSSHATA